MLNKSKRAANTHKGDYGRALVIAGSSGMTGAAVLAARGALRSGAGLTYLAVPKKLVDLVDIATPEVITLPFENIHKIKADATAIGPGLGISRQTQRILASLLSRAPSRDIPHTSHLVIDADALNVLAQNPALLKKCTGKGTIITPHPGEMSRLIKRSTEYIQKNRAAVAKDTARKFNCIVVLKGHKTVVAEPSGRVYINTTGNPGMASGGTGDVLTGMISGLIAQKQPVWEAAVTGVYVHGLAGDLAAKEKGEAGMTASDLVEKIPYALQRAYRKRRK
jgi:hydroxyethylthiazole kinase-like uncharacterized protein yjeF